MWYRLRGNNNKGPRGYSKPENDEMKMTFGDYLEHALLKDRKALGGGGVDTQGEYDEGMAIGFGWW